MSPQNSPAQRGLDWRYLIALLLLGFVLIAAGWFWLRGRAVQSPTQEFALGDVCANSQTTDADIAAYRGISLETMELLHKNRGLTSEEICVIAQDKLERAIQKAYNPKPDKPGEAMAFRMLVQQDENGFIPADGLQNAVEHVDEMRKVRTSSFGFDKSDPPEGGFTTPGAAEIDRVSWQWIGPGNVGGRVRSILIHPTTPDIMYAGSVSGGIWFTSDGGYSWNPLDDFMANIAVSTMVMDPNDPSTLYAGTGEGFYNHDAVRGAGIFKTVDGGSNWTQLAATANQNFYFVNRLAIDPNNGDILLAGTNLGIFRTTDGGATWTRMSTTRTLDLDFHPSNSSLVIAGGSGQAWYSEDGGLTWNTATFTGMTGTPGRVEVAYAPGAPTTVYASIDRSEGEIWRSTNGGQNYTRRDSTHYNFLGKQGWYDNVVWVDPTNADTIIIGGIDLWRSTNGGQTLTKISQWQSAPTSAHADHHAIVTHPDFDGTTNKTVLFGNDGGIYRTPDIYAVASTTGWQELNNFLGITQFFAAAGNVDSGVILGGTQDNGTLRYSGGSETWTETWGGDGGFVAADPNDPNYYYGEYVFLTIFRSDDGGVSGEDISGRVGGGWKNDPYRIPDAENEEANFIAPFVLDPNNSDRILAGGHSLWRTNDAKTLNTATTGPSWESIKAPAPSSNAYNNNISALDVAQGNPDLIWVGHNQGEVFVTQNGTDASPSWTQVDANPTGLPNRYVTRITIDPLAHDTVYVTFGGFSPDNVYRTQDGGASWTRITGSGASSLPSAPVRSLVIHPRNGDWLYVGTEVGVFASEDGGASWMVPHDGPANVSVDELFWMDDVLVAATHGRGLYKAMPPGLSIADVRVSDAAGDNDGVPEPGESLSLEIDLHNARAQIAYGVSGELQLTRGKATLTNASSPYANIFINATQTNITPYTLAVSEYQACGQLEFDLTVHYNQWGNITHRFYIPVCEPNAILLVDDDDNNPDVQAYFTDALETLGLPYDTWDVVGVGGEPDVASLNGYERVIWFSGRNWEFQPGPEAAGETALAGFLDQGKCLLVNSQDYRFDKGQTTFMTDYLGAAEIVNDAAQTQVSGSTGAIYEGLGPYALYYPYNNWSDIMTPTASASTAFWGDKGGAALVKDNGEYRTSFWSFAFESLPTESARVDALNAFLNWCDASADFSASPTAGIAPLMVEFHNLSPGSPTTSQWDFGDGSTSDEDTPSHIYTTPGVYAVSLTTGSPGWSETVERQDYITVYAPAQAAFSAAPVSGPAPLTVFFSDASSGDYDTHLWDFGDGDTSDQTNPTHTYDTPGDYTISLTIDGLGGTDTHTVVNYIRVSQPSPPHNVLFDEAHDEWRTLDQQRAHDLSGIIPWNPDWEWVYFGELKNRLAGEFSLERNSSAPLSSELMAGYDALMIVSNEEALTTEEVAAVRQYVASGGGLVLAASHQNPNLPALYGINTTDYGLFAPVPDLEGSFQVTHLADHEAVSGVTSYWQEWGGNLQVSSPAVALADTQGQNAWVDLNFNDQYDSGEQGIYDIAAAYDSGCGRVVVLGNDAFSDGVLYEHNNDVYMRALLDWVTDGKNCTLQAKKVLFDEAHGAWVSLDWTRAQELQNIIPWNPDPEWVYFGDLKDSLAYEFPLQRNASDTLTLNLLADYGALVVAMNTTPLNASEVQAVQDYVATGGGLVLIGSSGWENPNPDLWSSYDISFKEISVFGPQPEYNGDILITNFADHLAVAGVGKFWQNWGTSLGILGDAVSLADTTGVNAWQDANGNDQYDAGEEGVFDIAAAYDSGCGRVVALSDEAFHVEAVRYGNDVLMRALLAWVTGGTTCKLPEPAGGEVYLPVIFR